MHLVVDEAGSSDEFGWLEPGGRSPPGRCDRFGGFQSCTYVKNEKLNCIVDSCDYFEGVRIMSFDVDLD